MAKSEEEKAAIKKEKEGAKKALKKKKEDEKTNKEFRDFLLRVAIAIPILVIVFLCLTHLGWTSTHNDTNFWTFV